MGPPSVKWVYTIHILTNTRTSILCGPLHQVFTLFRVVFIIRISWYLCTVNTVNNIFIKSASILGFIRKETFNAHKHDSVVQRLGRWAMGRKVRGSTSHTDFFDVMEVIYLSLSCLYTTKLYQPISFINSFLFLCEREKIWIFQISKVWILPPPPPEWRNRCRYKYILSSDN